MVQIFTFKHGEIHDEDIDAILYIIKSTLSKIKNNVAMLEIHFFETERDLKFFHIKEAEEIGVKSLDIYFAMYDAWRGFPRISICIEKTRSLPMNVFIGGIRHEVGHAILHGSIRYYIISIPNSLMTTLEDANLSIDAGYEILSKISVAIKDYEVTKLLVNNGFLKCQKAFIKHILRLSGEEREIWNLSWNNYHKLLYLLSLYKVMACAYPIVRIPNIMKSVRDGIIHLPKDFQNMLLRSLNLLDKLGDNTYINIIKVCEELINILIRPVLGV